MMNNKIENKKINKLFKLSVVIFLITFSITIVFFGSYFLNKEINKENYIRKLSKNIK